MKQYTRAFTLIELSIVVVIIGLIVAGVVAGQSLVKQTKLKTIVSEVDKIKMALNSFQLQYNALPGDIANAYDYWGSSCDASATNCNGNNDKILDWGGANTDREQIRAWQHLSLANILPNNFIGVGNHAGGPTVLYYSSTGLGNFSVQTALNSRVFKGAASTREIDNRAIVFGDSTQGNLWYSTLSTRDAYHMDKKLDEGIANVGKVFSADGDGIAANRCSDVGSSSGGSDYNNSYFNDDTLHCYIVFFINR